MVPVPGGVAVSGISIMAGFGGSGDRFGHARSGEPRIRAGAIPYYFDRQLQDKTRMARSMTHNGGDERSDEH
jgi:hypothetical protein